MSTLDDAKKALDKVSQPLKKLSNKVSAWNNYNWFAIGGYGVQTASVITPIAIITTLQNQWVKTGIGFGVCAAMFALLIVFWKPIGALNKRAPGTLVFAIMFVIALAMSSMLNTLLIVAASGLCGSVAAAPLHITYQNKKDTKLTPEAEALREIAIKLNS